MTSNRPLATPEEVAKAIKAIVDYHERGRQSRKQSQKVEAQAAKLGWKADKLRKARQLAHPETGYDQDRLDELCELLLEHRPIFLLSHLGQLVTVPWPDRWHLQQDCIENNWSVKALKIQIKKKYGVRKHGGRKRQIRPDDALVRLADTTTSWSGLLKAGKKGQDGQPPAFEQLSPRVRARLSAVNGPMMRLRSAVLAELAAMREEAA